MGLGMRSVRSIYDVSNLHMRLVVTPFLSHSLPDSLVMEPCFLVVSA